MSASPHIVIAGGGTGGHVNPALAIADAFVAAHPGADVLFIGTAKGLEARLVPARGYRIELVEGTRLVGAGLLGKLRGLLGLWRGILQARRLIRGQGASLVIGVGGYASGAAVLAAKLMRVRTAIHESNAVPGMTNKVLGRLVDRVYLGFEAAKSAFPTKKICVTGNPVRAEIANVTREELSEGPTERRVLVVGGSQGALFLNDNVPALLGAVAKLLAADDIRLIVRHQVGKLEAAPVQAAYAESELPCEVVSYIDDMAAALAWADLGITRSGSGTVSELAASALPALLVPFPYAAGDHQAANAAAFCAAGGGFWSRQKDWNSEKLAQRIASVLTDNTALQRASDGAREVARPDAAEAVVRDCDALMEGRW
ncbi:MAG: undecaprenyldiphospho-muramoylpentapeptide beta-N-acetylglucosaminyltransferase [Myxococcales bacterium]|nr:undecaprenyldiphospho-muramoylpentapeptide beta-N-acetylglucosaminyltransferase [Myxococcales bacterium]